MRRINPEEARAAKWAALLALIFVLPVMLRAAGPLSTAAVHARPTRITPQEVQNTQAAQVTPEQSAPVGEAPGDDATRDPETGVPVADATEQARVLGTNPPGVWTYENSRIQARITREKRDDFVYFAADIKLTSPGQFSYAFSNEKYGGYDEALSDIAARHAPLIAINGDYYGFHDNGVIIRGGALFRNKYTERQMLIVEENGDLSVMTSRPEDQSGIADALMARGVRHTFEFGPVLVENGQAIEMTSAIMPVSRGYLEPRTAIGQWGPLHYLVIVVDGRSPGYSAGCDLPTLQQLFMDYGVHTAFNLDGGGSTTLWYDGYVINQPSSGDERRVSDIVMFMLD